MLLNHTDHTVKSDWLQRRSPKSAASMRRRKMKKRLRAASLRRPFQLPLGNRWRNLRPNWMSMEPKTIEFRCF